MYSVAGDESHDERRSRVFAVAGLFGDEETWKSAGAIWQARTKGGIFHAAECDSDTGSFANFSHDENKLLYRDLVRILADSRLLGFGAAVSLEAYNRVFTGAPDFQPYHFCLNEVISYFARIAHTCILRGQVHFEFDRNARVQHDAQSVYDYALSLTEWPYHQYLQPDQLGFEDRRNPKIQMADLLARETMKHLDNQIGPVQRRTRMSYLALARSSRFQFNFFLGEYFEDLVRRSNIITAARSGHTRQAYDAWLANNNQMDSVSSRVHYQFILDKYDRLAGHKLSVL